MVCKIYHDKVVEVRLICKVREFQVNGKTDIVFIYFSAICE